MTLEAWGWTPALAEEADRQVASLGPTAGGAEPGRVTRQESALLWVETATGTVLAKVAGKLRHHIASDDDLPIVGDWVLVTTSSVQDSQRHIVRVFPRRSLLTRRGRDDARKAQPLAANAEQVLLVWPLDRELNARWIERATTLTYDAGASPVIVLSKLDLASDATAAKALVTELMPHVPLFVVSAWKAEGLEPLRALLTPASTSALLGPSGAGKSSLANALIGEGASAVVSEVREGDRKGRHTTTHRELFNLPNGAMLIDSPGTRELGLWLESEGVELVFPEIDALAESCRFTDCGHETEPHCAVKEAVDAGTIDRERYESFLKLKSEQAWVASQTDPNLKKERERKARVLSIAGRTASKKKRER